MSADASDLFKPFELGGMTLPNRIVMAPLSRNRVIRGSDAANELMAQHYRQRASAGLLISVTLGRPVSIPRLRMMAGAR
jgi:N-ethylmaleimide reductase